MDTWLILYFLKKRGFIPSRRRPTKSFSLEDIFKVLADELKVYQPFTLEDKITLSGNEAKAIKELLFEDSINLSDDVINALLKILLEDETKLYGKVISTLSKIALEDSFDLSDNLVNVYSPMNLEDRLYLFSSCVKAYVSEALLNVEDEFTISDGLYKAFENILTINAEDSFNISDALIDMRLRINLEDSFQISDSLTKSAKVINLEDSFNINDVLAKSVKEMSLEDSFNVGDNLNISSKKETMEDTFSIGDNLKIFVAETEDEICDFMNLVTDYEYNYINVFFIKSKRLRGYYYMVIFVDGRDTSANKHYCIGYTTANEIYTHCERMVDYDCSSPQACGHDYADESEFVGAVCGGIDWIVLVYQAGRSVTITPKYIGENIIDVCGYERPAWSHFNGFVIHKKNGEKEYKSLEEFTVNYDTIKAIAFEY